MPPLINKLQTPKIFWYQNDLTVTLRILLHDVKNYFLHIESDHFQFSTILNGKNYYICLHLFGTVIPEETSHVNVGREIKVYLNKAHKWISWLRLHFDKCKYVQIIADPEHLYQTNWTNDKQPLMFKENQDFSEYKRRNNIGQIMPLVPSSDEEESDDDRYDAIFD